MKWNSSWCKSTLARRSQVYGGARAKREWNGRTERQNRVRKKAKEWQWQCRTPFFFSMLAQNTYLRHWIAIATMANDGKSIPYSIWTTLIECSATDSWSVVWVAVWLVAIDANSPGQMVPACVSLADCLSIGVIVDVVLFVGVSLRLDVALATQMASINAFYHQSVQTCLRTKAKSIYIPDAFTETNSGKIHRYD